MIFGEVLWWHYRAGLGKLFQAWGNIHWFFWHFFSMGELVRNLFAPFRRIRENPVRGFDPALFAQRLILNVITRLVGVFVRTAVLLVGLVAQAGTLVFGALVFLIALGAPVFLPALCIYGLNLIL